MPEIQCIQISLVLLRTPFEMRLNPRLVNQILLSSPCRFMCRQQQRPQQPQNSDDGTDNDSNDDDDDDGHDDDCDDGDDDDGGDDDDRISIVYLDCSCTHLQNCFFRD